MITWAKLAYVMKKIWETLAKCKDFSELTKAEQHLLIIPNENTGFGHMIL